MVSEPVSTATRVDANSSSAAESDVLPSKQFGARAQSMASSVEDDVDFPSLLRRE